MQEPITKKLICCNNCSIKAALIRAVLLLIIDRGLKMTALFYWSQQPQLLGAGWSLTYDLNERLAFSLPATGPLLTSLLTLSIAILTVYAGHAIKKQPSQLTGWLLLLIGAYSNLYDRFVYGGVIDYLANWWTIFNLADVLIITGLMLIIFSKQKERP